MNRRDFMAMIAAFAAYNTLGSINISQSEEINIDVLTGRIMPSDVVIKKDVYIFRKEAADAFEAMYASAKQVGIVIGAPSTHRSFNRQRTIWNNKFDRNKAKGLSDKEAVLKNIEYSTVPGTSRHHWATDADFLDLSKAQPSDPLQPRLFEQGQINGAMYQWLNENANKFGFYKSYTNHPDRKGFNYEPWHWTYAPLSKPMLAQYLQLSPLEVIKNRQIKGESVILTEDFWQMYLTNYIKGIAPELLP